MAAAGRIARSHHLVDLSCQHLVGSEAEVSEDLVGLPDFRFPHNAFLTQVGALRARCQVAGTQTPRVDLRGLVLDEQVLRCLAALNGVRLQPLLGVVQPSCSARQVRLADVGHPALLAPSCPVACVLQFLVIDERGGDGVACCHDVTPKGFVLSDVRKE